ncbi:MAG: PAS domain-containing protein, partial [Bacteriovoracaceae bacterium]|nr:PAS domain-containing protein [Bacteriovoracaceae bacterium]
MNIDSTSYLQEKLSSYSTLGGVKCEWECQLENTARIARSISRCDVAVLQVCESDSLFTSSTLAFELADDSLVDLTSSLVESQGNAMEVFQLRKKRNVKEHPYISGSPFFNYFAYIPILDGTGSRLGRLCLLGTKDNILEQDQWDGLDGVKEQVLFILESKRQQVQFRVSQKVARIGNWSLDVQGERIYWSDELFRIFGLDPGEGEPAFEEHIAKHIHPDDRELWLDKVTKAVKLGESYEMEFRGTQPSGKVVWLKAFGQAFRDEDGKIVSLSGTAQDITHSKLLEINNDKMRRESRKLLEEHKRFLINTLNNIPAVFYAKDRDGRLISINTAFEKLYKLKEQEVIGKTDHELFGAEVADAFRKNDLVVINKKDVIEAEEGAVGGDGKLRLYHSYKFPYYDEHGEVIATGGISIDVTEKKELERQAFLNSKLASVGELAAGVGHEINNPLA